MTLIAILRKPGARFVRLALLLAGAFAAMNASALPSFARQTGQDCAACHVGAYGPQLTPYGTSFKMGGYTDSDGKDGHVPLSAMILGTYTDTAKDLPGAPAGGFDTNDNAAVQEVSGFLAGKLGEHGGAFVQATYSGVAKQTSLDQVDLRHTRQVKLGGHDATIGVTLNNNPGVTDPFNTLPVWRFPFASSEFIPSPGAGTLLNGGLEGTVVGITGYAALDNGFYAEVGGYDSLSPAFLDRVNLDPGQEVKGLAPYARIAWAKDRRKSGYSVGLVAMSAEMRDHNATGAGDTYTDVGIDGSYQWLGNRVHVCTISGSYIHEAQQRDATFAAAGADHRNGSLNELNINTSYHYAKTWGFTAGYFNTSGSSDLALYQDTSTPVDGNASGSPDSSGYTMQVDWTPWGKEDSWRAPWANVRLGLQYTGYSKFNGGTSNYDGNGRDAADNNTVTGFVWTSF